MSNLISGNVGIVIVSHSSKIAEGAAKPHGILVRVAIPNVYADPHGVLTRFTGSSRVFVTLQTRIP